MANFEEVRRRQFDIASLYLAGKHFKLWGCLPYRSMERTAKMFGNIVKTGPYSDVAPQAQLNIGAAREKQKALGFRTPDYSAAIKAYDVAADRYSDQPKVASEAIYRAGLAYQKQALTADRDQGTAGQAMAKFADFMALYESDARVPQAKKIIASLKEEQARATFHIAQFYEKRKKWEGARKYYSYVQNQDPNSPYTPEAMRRLDQINQRLQGAGK
jgi:outer membrane assembly lipoprotein YfiO